jgi:VWFA-related protein
MRAVLVAAMAVAVLPHRSGAQQQPPPLVERVEVVRILIDARVFDDKGRAVPDLTSEDFDVEIGGRAARVESSEWIGPVSPRPATSGEDATTASFPAAASPPRSSEPRLTVFLVQRSLERLRITGLMRVAQLVERLLAPLTPADRVAVVSFDSRLRFWTDFTNDLGRVRAILANDVINGRPGAMTAARDVSLVSGLDRPSDARIFTVEHALRRIGEALEPLPGAKSVVVLGYGFGRFNARTRDVVLMDGYAEASAALQRARAAVFTLNVTQADFNSLQAGLQTVSAETGGMYASAYLFPARAIDQIARGLEGHYVLFVEKPDLRSGTHRIEVQLTRRTGTVIARRAWSN